MMKTINRLGQSSMAKNLLINALIGFLFPVVLVGMFVLSFPISSAFASGGEKFFQEPFMIIVLVTLICMTVLILAKYGWSAKPALKASVAGSLGLLTSSIAIFLSWLITSRVVSLSVWTVWLSALAILMLISIISQQIGKWAKMRQKQ